MLKSSNLVLRELKIMSKVVDSFKRQECPLKSKFQAGMKFSGANSKEKNFF